jgi:DNA polymerase-3 subunit gamma/tau
MWPEAMAALAGRKRTTWSLVSQYAQVLDFNGERLVLGFDSEGRAGSFIRGAHAEVLRQVLIDVLGLDCRFEAIGTDRGPVQARPTSSGTSGSAGHRERCGRRGWSGSWGWSRRCSRRWAGSWPRSG